MKKPRLYVANLFHHEELCQLWDDNNIRKLSPDWQLHFHPLAFSSTPLTKRALIRVIRLWYRLIDEGLIPAEWDTLAVYKCTSKGKPLPVNPDKIEWHYYFTRKVSR